MPSRAFGARAGRILAMVGNMLLLRQSRAVMRRAAFLWLIGSFALAAWTGRAEFVLSLFSAATLAEDSDLRLRQSGGTDLVFHDVSFSTKDWESPIYYGGRLAYFLPKQPQWGFGLEFFHAKIYLNTEDTVRVTGTRSGQRVNDSERVGDTIESFNISHGLNFLTVDAMYRWILGERGKNFLGRFQPYVGGGIGVAIAHVESMVGGIRFEEYQLHGPAYQAFCGLNFELTKHFSLFTDYKFTYVDLARLNIPSGSIGLAPMNHHFVTGLSFRF